MENNIKNYQILLSRGDYIEDSRAIAVLRLNERIFKKGEPTIISYYKNPDFRTDVGTLLALGVEDGKGDDCYRIISTGDTVLVRAVVDSLPDVSNLVHGELYIYKDASEVWYYVYKNSYDAERTIEVITGGPYIFLDVETGYRWFYENQDCKREDDFLRTDKLKAILIKLTANKGYLEVTSDNGNIFKVGQVRDAQLTIKAWSNKTKKVCINEDCEFYINNQRVSVPKSGMFTYPNISKDTTLEIEARIYLMDNLYLSLTRSINYYFGYYFYYGVVGQNWTLKGSSIKVDLPNRKLWRKIDFEWSGINMKLGKTVIAYPQTYGLLEHIYDDHGIDYIDDYQVNNYYLIDDIIYIVYIKKTPATISGLKQVFSFDPIILPNKTVDLGNLNDIDGENIMNLVTTWDKRNTGDGFLVLDEDGKIPDEILARGFYDSRVQFIEEFVDEYPTDDMIPGGLYYNKTENMIMKAIKLDEGQIISPSENIVYIYRADLSNYIWTGTELVHQNILQYEDIEDITDIL